jgi:thiamine pyrophosphate-dependent acetolactate synthase large subunit-like protein
VTGDPTVAEAVGRALAAEGARTVIGVLGSGNFHVTNALVASGARFVAARHEAGAATMADAYARASGELGVVTVHQGPGLTNAVTGIAEAAKSRTPLLVLAADTAAAAARSNFRIDQAGLVESVGAVSERLASPATAVADAVRAARRARLERRTVVLQMPLDVQAAPAPDVPAPPDVRPPAPLGPDPAAVARLCALLDGAERPVLIAGRGAVLPGARDLLETVAERTGALLATTAVAHGLFAGNPWSLGISGGFASPVASDLLAHADVVVAFGASLTMWTTRHGRLLHPDAVVAKVDDNPAALGVDSRVDLGVGGDVAATARALLDEVERHGTGPGATWRTAEVRARITAGGWRETPYDDAGEPDRIDPRTLTKALDDLLPAERVLVTDSGAFMGWPAMYLRVPDERGFVFTQSFQSVGLGLATAVGVRSRTRAG